MVMTLKELRIRRPDLAIAGDAGICVDAVADDSRRCRPGTLFIAVEGNAADGHGFLAQAVAAGCSAVVIRTGREGDLPVPCPVPVLSAPDTRPLPGCLARELAGRPDVGMTVAGITGTNGKTTTAYLLQEMLGAVVGRCGLLGTVVYDTGASVRPAPLTTPGGIELFDLLAEMAGAGCRAAALEISSHALDQDRAADLALDVAVMTNLSRDHLDYHHDFESYLAAKSRILDLVREGIRRGKNEGAVVLNAGDPAIADVDTSGLRTLRYATGWRSDPGNADLKVVDAALDRAGTRLELDFRGRRLKLASSLIGRFNVENLTAALAAGLALGLSGADCCEALAGAGQVPGRVEPFALPSGAVAVVDYAHTPDALEAVLRSCRELTPGRLMVVFGCGGDRDKGKRPQMGAVAAREADETWITSDNPRSEKPEAICEDVAAGFRAEKNRLGSVCRVEVDRASAIIDAIAQAGAGDVVVVAGKGHEDYQLVADRRLDLDDRGIIRDWIGREARP